MIVYGADAGFRPLDRVWVEEGDDTRLLLHHHVRHSPDGHAWGYGGSGPTELAKDILWHFLGREPEVGLYQDFRRQFIEGLHQDHGWRIGGDVIATWLATKGVYRQSA